MLRLLAAALLLATLTAIDAAAHPSTSIVIDSRGNVFFSDLEHVWRVDTAGRRSIAVRDVHTHELSLDERDTLFGEDNDYLGGDRYRNRVWQRTADGRVSEVIGWRDGFWRQYGFARAGGATYWVQCPEQRCAIRRRTRDGRVTTLAEGPQIGVRTNWIVAAASGELYFIVGESVRRLDRAGNVSVFAANVGRQLMGMFVDRDGSLLVSAAGDKRIVRIAPDGRSRSVVARSEGEWGPTGVTRARNGDLWLLEWSSRHKARVRHIDAAGRSRTY